MTMGCADLPWLSLPIWQMGLLDECLERGTKEDFMENGKDQEPKPPSPTLVRDSRADPKKLSGVVCTAPAPPTTASHQALHNLLRLCRRFHHLTVPFTPGPGRQSQNMINHVESWDTQETSAQRSLAHRRPTVCRE